MSLTIDTSGFDRAARAIAEQARTNTQNYGREIAREYEQTAKHDAPWTDRKGIARSGITGSVKANGDRVEVHMGASAKNYRKMGPRSVKDYMEALEFAMDKRYAVVYPTFEAIKNDVIEQYGRAALTGARLVIRRDKAWAKRRQARWAERKRRGNKK